MWEIIQYLTEITMNNQENQNELLQVQKEIAELPAGYLVVCAPCGIFEFRSCI